MSYFPPFGPPIATSWFYQKLDRRSFFFLVEFSKDIRDIVERISLERLICPDGKVMLVFEGEA